ncbi:MAG: Leu/Phe/Val dehydrogenase [Thermoanaerobaculia bacterium]
MTLEEISTGTGHERVVFCRDPEAGYRAFIAVHSTAAGMAVGGTRYWRYVHETDALTDALRLSRGMTYKNLMAGLPLGGGKSVILRGGDPAEENREAVFRAHGRAIERLGGLYLTAEDVGTSPAEMEIIRQETQHVAGLLGDPSPDTARGVLRAMAAAAFHRWGSDGLAGRTVAIQGCGNVGFHLALGLAEAGARLIVADVDSGRVRRTVEATGTRAVDPGEIHRVEADIFAPCALGGILSSETIPGLRVEIVAGAANNQLWTEEDGRRLSGRGILYAPDYVANAGGVIGGCREILGWSEAESRRRIDGIYDTLLDVLRSGEAEGLPPHAAADRLAEERMATLEAERRQR